MLHLSHVACDCYDICAVQHSNGECTLNVSQAGYHAEYTLADLRPVNPDRACSMVAVWEPALCDDELPDPPDAILTYYPCPANTDDYWSAYYRRWNTPDAVEIVVQGNVFCRA